MEKGMVFQSTMTGNAVTYYNEGLRALALHIMHMREQGWQNEIVIMRKQFEKSLEKEE
jgi:hypothetical protein